MKQVITYTLLVLVMLACKPENRLDCFKGTGADVLETRYPGPFDSLDVIDHFDVELSTGTEYKVEVKAGKNIIGNIKTSVKNGELILENLNKCNFVRGYKRKVHIQVTVPKLKKVYHTGVGPLTIRNFYQDTLNVRSGNSGDMYIYGNFMVINASTHGNGDIYYNGTARELLVYTNGINFVRAENMQVSDHIYISTYSLGDAHFNFSGLKLFDYYIWGTGNIYYTGTPASIVNLGETSTKGKLIKQD